MSAIKPLVIGNVTLKNNIIFAPMAGFSDIAMRKLAREYGAGLTVTEMVSVKGLKYGNVKTEEYLRIDESEQPSCVQLFGAEPDLFAEVLTNCEHLDKFDIIDINMGCPVPKVTKSGEGSALMRNIPLSCKIVETCAKSTNKPITVKFRLGVDEANENFLEFGRAMEGSGAQMVTLHGRYAKQLYTGKANWDKIEQLAAALTIPVIGNGDIDSVTSCHARLEGAVSGVMIGRGAIGKPDLFAHILGQETNEILKQIILKHIDYMRMYFPNIYTVSNFRKHLAFYMKGIVGGKFIKTMSNTITDIDELIELVNCL